MYAWNLVKSYGGRDRGRSSIGKDTIFCIFTLAFLKSMGSACPLIQTSAPVKGQVKGCLHTGCANSGVDLRFPAVGVYAISIAYCLIGIFSMHGVIAYTYRREGCCKL